MPQLQHRFSARQPRKTRISPTPTHCRKDEATILHPDLDKGDTEELKLCIDLCSGLGGLSSAFKANGWEVVTVDIEPKFGSTICKDIRQVSKKDIQAVAKLSLEDYEEIIVVASPPCQRFSFGNRMFPKKGVREALEIVGSVFELIADIRPNHWIVENPKGRLRWFIGKPTSSINLSDYGSKYLKPTDLWHNLTFTIIEGQRPYEPSWSSVKNSGKGSTGLLRLRDPAKRAKMPYDLSDKIRLATEAEANPE